MAKCVNAMGLPILLIVEDEEATREGLREALEERFDIYVAADLAGARSILKMEDVDVLLTDLRLGAENGMDLLGDLKGKKNAPVSVVMTAYGSVETAVAAVKAGAFHFVTKPLNIDEVELILLRAYKSLRLSEENVALQKEVAELKKGGRPKKSKLDDIIGSSPKVQQMKQVIRQVASTKATVLIEGESGTGKELIAHALHDLSGRDKLVIVNCAALPSNLLESELFGHEKGAFTDAKTQRVGRFEEATNGTLFLDEIGEIDAGLQVKLLRALSERTIQRVGSNKSISIDTRVVAATNKSLSNMVEDGEFREDLYFRLNVVKVTPPPLRERLGDIPILSKMLLKRVVEDNGLPEKSLSVGALEMIEAQDWPGNVRQLAAVIESAAIMSSRNEIIAEDLPRELILRQRRSSSESGREHLSPEVRFLLSEVEARTIESALDYTTGNKSEASTLLGISRRTLQRKIQEMGL